jgi:hypothetical protein
VEELPGGIEPLIDWGNGRNMGTGIVNAGTGVTRIEYRFNLGDYIGEHGCLHIR